MDVNTEEFLATLNRGRIKANDPRADLPMVALEALSSTNTNLHTIERREGVRS
jgi:hypothetical protein